MAGASPTMGTGRRPLLAVFASDRGPGDAERASIMVQAGGYFARHGADIIVIDDDLMLPVPLITAARAGGGQVTIIGGPTTQLPLALSEVQLERLDTKEERIARMAELAQVFVGLPGSLQSVASLYAVWARAGAGAGGKGVALLNRNRAFEVLRGLAVDVVAHDVRGHDRMIQFADTVPALWGKIAWLTSS